MIQSSVSSKDIFHTQVVEYIVSVAICIMVFSEPMLSLVPGTSMLLVRIISTFYVLFYPMGQGECHTRVVERLQEYRSPALVNIPNRSILIRVFHEHQTINVRCVATLVWNKSHKTVTVCSKWSWGRPLIHPH